MSFSRIIPFAFFLILAAILTRGLWLDPRLLPSTRIGKPVPEFSLPALDQGQPQFESQKLKGNITLINFWGSWCPSCRQEHEFLMSISQNPRFNLVGIDWKDPPQNAKIYLQKYGNPFAQIGMDQDGRAALDFGISGAPETFLVDTKGIVRLRVTGPLSTQIWNEQVEPILAKVELE